MNMHVENPTDQPLIIMSRTLDAPRDLVWTAFTDPKHVAKWYGGHGFTNPVCTMDVRPGGLWRHTMRTPDGTEFAMEFVYVEVVRPERLVWKSSKHDQPAPPGMLHVVNTLTLAEEGRQTRWTLVSLFKSLAERDLASGMGYSRIITQGSEKLEDVVKSLSSAVAVAP